jgi:hypothetical protein
MLHSRILEKKIWPVQLPALVFFLGGLARIVSMPNAGPPHSFFITMTELELCLPIVIWFMFSRVSHAEPAAKDSGRTYRL